MGDASEWYADQIEGEERERRELRRQERHAATLKLDPYDTGVRAEPKPWPLKSSDDYGKVDLEDDAGTTIATIWAEKAEGSDTYTLVIEQHLPIAVNVKVYD